MVGTNEPVLTCLCGTCHYVPAPERYGPGTLGSFIMRGLPPKCWYPLDYSRRSYLKWGGRYTNTKIVRGSYVHRVTMEVLICEGVMIRSSEQRPLRLSDLAVMEVHHQDGDPWNNCPQNLTLVPACLHIKGTHSRCPYTGRFMSIEELERSLRGANRGRMETNTHCR